MIDRYIDNSAKAWCACKDSVSHAKVLPDSGTAGLVKAKQAKDGPSEKGDSQGPIRSTRSATRSQKLFIKIPAIVKSKESKKDDVSRGARASMRNGKAPIQVDIEETHALPAIVKPKESKEDTILKGTRASTRKWKAPIQVDVEETHGHSISSEGKATPMNKHTTTTQQTVEKFRALSISIEKDEGVAAHSAKKEISSFKSSTQEKESEPYGQKDGQNKSRTIVVKGGRKQRCITSIVRDSPVQPESEEVCEVNEFINSSVQWGSKLGPARGVQPDNSVTIASNSVRCEF
jgi:hypothetical protein